MLNSEVAVGASAQVPSTGTHLLHGTGEKVGQVGAKSSSLLGQPRSRCAVRGVQLSTQHCVSFLCSSTFSISYSAGSHVAMHSLPRQRPAGCFSFSNCLAATTHEAVAVISHVQVLLRGAQQTVKYRLTHETVVQRARMVV